jgi:hypothetical protein
VVEILRVVCPNGFVFLGDAAGGISAEDLQAKLK